MSTRPAANPSNARTPTLPTRAMPPAQRVTHPTRVLQSARVPQQLCLHFGH
jgi:hypothetical protein